MPRWTTFAPWIGWQDRELVITGAYTIVTLWLCQNSYRKWPFVASLSVKNGDFP